VLAGAVWAFSARPGAQPARPHFSVDEILGLPTPDNLVAAPAGAAVAWTFNERGARNIYVAEAPDFSPRRLTTYMEDDGQELSHVGFAPDGRTLVYVRGGDHGSARPGAAPNPAASPVQPRMQVWSVPYRGGRPVLLGDGDSPAVAPDSRRVAFVRDGRIWIAPLDGTTPAEAAFYARGAAHSPAWSPDGSTLAFVSNRDDHSFVGLFTPGQPIRYLAPSTSRDSMPAWSRDGQAIAFLRQPGRGGTPRSPLVRPEAPWTIMVAEPGAVSTRRENIVSAVQVWTSGRPIDPILQNPGGIGLQWAADDTLVFMSYRDGWPHLYGLRQPTEGHAPTLLTPGALMVEQVTLTPDGRFAIYNANAGPKAGDVDRRHLFKVPIDRPTPAPLTSGDGIEWSPVVTGDGRMIVCLTSDARRPPLPAVLPVDGGTPRRIAGDLVPADFPGEALVVPEAVVFRASDGVEVRGQLFRPPDGGAAKPAVVYVHGGGPRQMLLGWHYRWEYAYDYGANQYLASLGFVVLSVNYRLSVGYGRAFQFPERTGPRGASEYLDIVAAGRYLQSLPDVDPARIGIWGASYGGYLTALALGRDSDLFAAGVDVHGVHDRLGPLTMAQWAHAMVSDGVSEADLRSALKVEFESSPIASVGSWTSPVLFIHGDDDRSVDFHQTVDLVRRLVERGVEVRELVLPDDVHDSLLWRNWRATFAAMGAFFERTLQGRADAAGVPPVVLQ
jgi:dipeptidyl aminopeptidase/acylaminoacyl peptidase